MDKDESLKQEPIRGWFTADEFVEMADRRTKEWAKQADIPDLIAGALGVSRGTAYDMMREALKEALLVQEPEIVQRVRRYAGQTMRTARNPNITARECIELANWLAANTTPPTAQRQWVDPNKKSQKQFLPHIGEPVLFCHDGVTYFGKHTGGSFTTGQGITTRNFNTWECHWMYPPSAKLKEKNT